jgi:hypothetical protein
MHDPTLNLVHYGVCKYQFHRCAQHSQRHQGTPKQKNTRLPHSHGHAAFRLFSARPFTIILRAPEHADHRGARSGRPMQDLRQPSLGRHGCQGSNFSG